MNNNLVITGYYLLTVVYLLMNEQFLSYIILSVICLKKTKIFTYKDYMSDMIMKNHAILSIISSIS